MAGFFLVWPGQQITQHTDHEVVTVLLSAFDWRETIPKPERQALIWEGIRLAAANQVITGSGLNDGFRPPNERG